MYHNRPCLSSALTALQLEPHETDEQRLTSFLRAAYLASIVDQDAERGARKTNPLHKGVADYIEAVSQRRGPPLTLTSLDSHYRHRNIGKPVVQGRFIQEKQGDAGFDGESDELVCVEVKFPTKTYGKNEINHFEILLGQVANLKLNAGEKKQKFFFVQVRRTEFPVDTKDGASGEKTEVLTNERLFKYKEVMSLSAEAECVVRPDYLLFILVEIKVTDAATASSLIPELAFRDNKQALRDMVKPEVEAFEVMLAKMKRLMNVQHEATLATTLWPSNYQPNPLSCLPSLYLPVARIKKDCTVAFAEQQVEKLVEELDNFLGAADDKADGIRKRLIDKLEKLSSKASDPSMASQVIRSALWDSLVAEHAKLVRSIEELRQAWLDSRCRTLTVSISPATPGGHLTDESLAFLRQYGPSPEADLGQYGQAMLLSGSGVPVHPTQPGSP